MVSKDGQSSQVRRRAAAQPSPAQPRRDAAAARLTGAGRGRRRWPLDVTVVSNRPVQPTAMQLTT